MKSFVDLSKDPQEKIKKHYADIVKSAGKPVVVFVDDLDRYRRETLHYHLRSLRLLAPFRL